MHVCALGLYLCGAYLWLLPENDRAFRSQNLNPGQDTRLFRSRQAYSCQAAEPTSRCLALETPRSAKPAPGPVCLLTPCVRHPSVVDLLVSGYSLCKTVPNVPKVPKVSQLRTVQVGLQ